MAYKIKRDKKERFRSHDYVIITMGKFKGWRGWIGFSPLTEKGKYTIYPDYIISKGYGGKVCADFLGLGSIINVPKGHIKKVK